MWKDKLKLGEGETLRLDRDYTKGSMAQEDVYEYSVLNTQGDVVGRIVRRDETTHSLQRRQSLEQRDSQGNVLVAEYWTGD
ncbi:hypothetical protein LU676_14325 [Pseudomonas alloputida]|uniref:hypothetical protein n=1 Tax=Pseudomonas alloputida TaxID=1940621 RepID=UPI001E4087B6|nr:hypothetical protein [Pseudomonas alloputida]MCE0903931.1 hypothetical protein [Pseudomonas alloputida]